MNTSKWKKLKTAGLMVCFGVLLLAGCEKEKIDYGIGEEGTQGSISQKGVAQFKDDAGLVGADKWRSDGKIKNASGEEANLIISATISIPEEEQMDVWDVAPIDFSPEGKKAYAEALFGQVYSADESKADIQYWLDRYLDCQQSYEEEIKDIESSDVVDNLEWIKTRLSETRDEIAKLQKKMEGNPQQYVLEQDFDKDKFLGVRDGFIYEIRFNEDDEEMIVDGYSAVALEGLFDGKTKTMVIKSIGTEEGKELRELDEDSKAELAKKVVADLGLEGYFMESVSPDSDEPEDGSLYLFNSVYGKTPVSEDAVIQNIKQIHKESGKAPDHYGASTVQVWVGNHGELNVHCYNPWYTVRVTENVNLMPLKEMKEIIEHELVSDMEQFYLPERKEYFFNHLDLTYFRIRNKGKEDSYCYIPAWILSTGQNANLAVFNAMDGSVIDIAEQY